jgi:hypothetical protein
MASHTKRKKSSYLLAQETQSKETDDDYDYEYNELLPSSLLLFLLLLSSINYWSSR